MINFITDRIDKLLGRGAHSIAVPVLDGPFHPNQRLEEAKELFAAPMLDNLVVTGDDIYFSSGSELLVAHNGAVHRSVSFQHDISCLSISEDGGLAIGFDGHGILLQGGVHDGKTITELGGAPLTCATAMAFSDPNNLIVAIGARARRSSEWKRDLMEHGKSGEVWRINLPTGDTELLAQGLAYPYGVCVTETGIVVSEAWAHRLILLNESKAPEILLSDLAGYPARIVKKKNGGYLLAIFAARNQLVEFVLREPEFLRAMTTQVHPDNWIAPKLRWGQGFKEPMQGAALKTMGIIKPWAPTWSYGLVAELDDGFQPIASYHSRADGTRHGVTSVAEYNDNIIIGAKGAGMAVLLSSAIDGASND